MRFNFDKCKTMQLGLKNPHTHYHMKHHATSKLIPLEHTSCEKDLGLNIDNQLKFSTHTSIQINKANRILGMIKRTFTELSIVSFKSLFVSLVRPHLEYCSSLYSPRFVQDRKSIENVLKRASKLVTHLHHLNYEQRLQILDLPSMKYRFERGDMIQCYKIVHSYYDFGQFTPFTMTSDSITRGHD